LVLEGEKVLEGLVEAGDVFRLLFLKKEVLGAMDKRKTHVLEVRGETHEVSRDIVGETAIVGEFSDGNEQLLCGGHKLVGESLLVLRVDLQVVLVVIDDKSRADDDVVDVVGELLAVGPVDKDVLLLIFCEER
jgi:hypothetical protein